MSSKLCPFCMRMTEHDTCPHCGKNIHYAGQPLHLPAGYVLNGKHPYVIGAALGQGGFGITYIALDMVTSKRVAIKEYFPTYCSGRTGYNTVTAYQSQEDIYSKGRERFLDEAKTLKSLSDLPHIVNVLDFFAANNTAYLVMEYLEGSSLKDYAAKHGKFPAKKFLAQIKPLMEDIQKMHERGVIHRDIAPDNIMLLPDGQMKLIDFGAARSYLGDKSMTVVVKKGFAPVEQYFASGCTASTDVYALAATIYYCITGIVPMESAQRQSEGTPLTAPSGLGADITHKQEKALLKALEISQKTRTQSMQTFLEDLTSRKSDSTPDTWTCPECRMVNTGSKCIRCGHKKDAGSNGGNGGNGRKKLIAVIAVIGTLMLMAVVGFFTIHSYSEPTCTKGAICQICGKAGDEPALGHTWKDATCTAPKTCTVCNTSSGMALGHSWKAATCTTPKTCKTCGETSGTVSGHKWTDATYDRPKTCSVCKKTEGNVKGYIGDVDGRYTGEKFYRSGRRTSCYVLDDRIEDCRKFTLNYTISNVTKGSVYGNFEVFVRYGDKEWEWHSLGIVKITEDRVHIPFELEKGISFDAVAVVCNAYGSYSYSSSISISDVQVY